MGYRKESLGVCEGWSANSRDTSEQQAILLRYSIFERRDDFNLTPVASLIESTPDKHGCFTH